MPEYRNILPLTDENLEKVNKLLWRKIKSGNMKELHGALHGSMKSKISYDAMKRYINEGLKHFNLRNIKKTKESEEVLKIRITPHQFLLNNILAFLEITFEELFECSNFENKQDNEEELEAAEDVDDKEINDCEAFMKTINRKLDKIIELNTKSKKKSYAERFVDIDEYLSAICSYFLSVYDSPEKNGFSISAKTRIAPVLHISHSKAIQIITDAKSLSLITNINQENENLFRLYRLDSPEKTFLSEIYTYEKSFLTYFIPLIHKKSKIHSLFERVNNHKNEDARFGRLLFPFLILMIFIDLMKKFIEQANANKKNVFSQFTSEDKIEEIKNEVMLDYCKDCDNHLLKIIEHILESDIYLDEKLFINHEKIMYDFFSEIKDIFKSHIPVQQSFEQIFKKIKNLDMHRKKLEEMIINLNIPGDEFSCYITKEQIETFKGFPKILEDAQINLENYYEGNEHKRNKPVNGITTIN